VEFAKLSAIGAQQNPQLLIAWERTISTAEELHAERSVVVTRYHVDQGQPIAQYEANLYRRETLINLAADPFFSNDVI